MFGKKKDQEMSTNADTSTASPAADQSKSYLRQDAPSSPGVSRPAAPEIARRPPDLSAFTQRRDQPTSPRAGETTDHKKLIVGREIILNGEIRTCDFLVVEGRVEERRHGMVVGDEVERFAPVLKLDCRPHHAEVVADVERA